MPASRQQPALTEGSRRFPGEQFPTFHGSFRRNQGLSSISTWSSSLVFAIMAYERLFPLPVINRGSSIISEQGWSAQPLDGRHSRNCYQ